MDNQRGQVALLLILAMTVMGVISVSLASRSVTGLRSTEIDQGSTAAFKAAEAGLEQAILNKANVSGSLTSGDITYNATYTSSGGNGYVTAPIEAGDIVSVSLAGASGITAINVYWNNNAAIKTSDLRGSSVTGAYGVRYLASDPDGTRAATNMFTPTVEMAGYSYAGTNFAYRLSVPINLTVAPVSQILNILVLYAKTPIGIEPIGGSLAAGQLVSVSSTGKAGQFSSKVTEQRFTQKLPVIFDNVIYTNGVISQ